MIESGQRIPSLKVLEKIASILELEVGALISLNSAPDSFVLTDIKYTTNE